MSENQISNKIKKIMRDRNISLLELCHKSNISKQGLYQMLESNSYKVETLQRIAEAIDVDIKYFFDDTGSFPSTYNNLKNENESFQALLRIAKKENDLLYFMVSELLHFVLSNTYYNELIENYVKATEYFELQMKIAKRMKTHKPYKEGYYVPFNHDTVMTIINIVLFEHPAIAQAFEKKKIKNDLLIKQYAEWKANPPQYPEIKD